MDHQKLKHGMSDSVSTAGDLVAATGSSSFSGNECFPVPSDPIVTPKIHPLSILMYCTHASLHYGIVGAAFVQIQRCGTQGVPSSATCVLASRVEATSSTFGMCVVSKTDLDITRKEVQLCDFYYAAWFLHHFIQPIRYPKQIL